MSEISVTQPPKTEWKTMSWNLLNMAGITSFPFMSALSSFSMGLPNDYHTTSYRPSFQTRVDTGWSSVLRKRLTPVIGQKFSAEYLDSVYL